MKLILNSFLILLLFICFPVFGVDASKTYVIKVSGIKIGKLDWVMNINNKNYTNSLKLKSEGFLSAIYKFEGEYFSKGEIENKKLKPKKYTHLWKTNKASKKMTLLFDNNTLKSIEQKPVEEESLRIDVYNIKNAKDPLTSFLQIIMGIKKSLVIDGRRFYTMNALHEESIKQTTVELTNYSNLWADHKRSDFEKISFKKNKEDFLPTKIFIYFDSRVFKLEQI